MADNTAKRKEAGIKPSALGREIAALTRLYNSGHISAAEHKRRYDALVGAGNE